MIKVLNLVLLQKFPKIYIQFTIIRYSDWYSAILRYSLVISLLVEHNKY